MFSSFAGLFSHRGIARFLLLGIAALTSLVAAHAGTIYVRADASAGGNGASWATAYNNLQTALAQVNGTTPTEIWIATGVYKPTSGLDRSISFILKSNLTLRGGFFGTEATAGERPTSSAATAFTVLSGDIADPQIDAIGAFSDVNSYASVVFDIGTTGAQDNSFNVLRASNLSGVTLDRIVVAGGYANFNEVTQFQIENILRPSYPPNNGPGFLEPVSKPMYNRVCGGALHAYNSSIIISDCWLVGNFAGGLGGAIAARGGFIDIRSSRVVRNVARQGGGGAALQAAEVAAIGNTFYGNSTSFLGAGLLIQADNGAKQLKTYEAGLLDSLAALTSVNSDTTPTGILQGPSTAYDQAKLLKAVSSIGTSIASALVKPIIIAAATNGVTIATKVATLSLANLPNLLGTAYGALSIGVAIGDVAVQVAIYYGADPDNVHLQNYMAFSDAFNTYLTPVGWAKLIAAAAYTPKTPSLEERATTRRFNEYQLLQNKIGRYTLSHNRFEANASAGMGGAIATLHANVLISQSWFVKNTAMFGGSAGAFFCYNETWIESSAFVDNTAEYGNTLTFGFRALGRIIHTTIVGSHTDNAYGHAIGADAGADVSLINTVLWGNTSGKLDDTTNLNRFGGADLFATRYEDLSAAGQQAYRDADDRYGSLIAVIDAQVCDIQSLDRLPTGKVLFYLGGGSNETEDYNGILAAGVRPNVGEGIRPLAGRGNFSRDPILAGRIYPHPSLSPLLNVGRKDLSWGGSNLSFESEREYGAFGGGPEVGVIESDGALPPATILYVNAAAPAGGDGFTWNTAFRTIHEACDVAVAPGAQIWVAPGTYYPTSGTDRSATLYLRRGVTLVGSLPVGSSSIAQSNPTGENLTIISGDIGIRFTASDNSRGLVSGRDFDFYAVTKGTELPRVIRGIRFTGTEGNGTSSAVQLAAPAIIQFCTFDYNLGGRALTLDEPAGVEEETYARVEDSTFASNPAGAIDCFTYNLDIYRCQFFDNTAPNGAALFKRNGRVHTSLTVERSVFYNNTATSGRGGAIDTQDWTLELAHNVFADNLATLPFTFTDTNYRGAGVWWGVDSAGWNATARLTLVNNIFSGNRFTYPYIPTGIEYHQFGYATPTGQRFEFTISGNNIEGLDVLATLPGSSGNVDFDPFFVNKTGHDFHLRDNSYLLNRGAAYTSGTDVTVQVGNRDIGLHENPTITTIAAPQPVVFTALPATEDGRIYTLQVAAGVTGAQNYRWQIRRTDGTGFVNITAADAPALTGFDTDTLTFTNPGRDLNGCVFRLIFTGTNANLALYSAAHTLNVTPGVLYVVPGGAGLKNGGSWANAYAFVNQACDNAIDGTQIWIARGTYGTGRYQPGNTVINQSYATIPPGVSLYGGFVGTETSLSQRPAFDLDTTPDAQRTLLTKGDSNIQLINISGSGTVANRIDRITFSGSGGPTGIALVATNARVQLTNVRNHYVAQGMRFTDSQVTLTDTRHAFNNGTALVFFGSTATLSRVRAENNGDSGYGNQCGGLVASDSALTIADSLIAQNKGLYAGGIQIYGASALDVQRTLFRGNKSVGANQGGGAINFGSSISGQVANSLFQDNLTGGVTVTGNSGSAVRTSGSATLTLRHCTIVANRVDRGGGAPLHGASGTLAVVNSIVWGNTAEGASVVTQGNVTVTSSYVQGQAPLGFYEPFFVDPAASDYRLTYASPMRDLVTADQSGLGSTDLAGLARRQFSGVDLGAYEFSTLATGTVPVLSRPAAAVVYAENPVSFTLTAASTFTWEYFTGVQWLSVSGHDGWTTSATPVTTNGIAATAFTLSHAAVPAAYVATPIQLRARSIDNSGFSIPASLTVNARQILRVNASAAPSGGNGLAWATAFNSVSAALAASNAGTDLWISAGDYLESYTPAVQFVRYYPGFAGTESLVTERNAVTHPVYLASSVSKLLYNPADSRTAPVNTHQFTTAPASVAAYVDRPASFLVTTPAEVVWQSSSDGVTWLNIGSTPGWSTSVSGTAKTLSLAAVTAPLNGLRLRAIIAATGEFSGFAFLTATPRHVLYVNAAAAGGNGQSWAAAFNTIASALAAADDGADLWIATGVYSAPAVSVPAGTKLYSGFTGTETAFEQRNVAAHPVVFNGGASSLTLPADSSLPSSVYQLTAAPVSTTVYAENPASFSATSTATVAWQYSANGGTTWSDISGLSGWSVTVAGNVSTLAASAASSGQTNHRFRAVIAATGETSPAAILTVNARAVRYVRASAPASPAPTGLSWATAYRTISAALATANAGTDLWIATGDYAEPSLPAVALVRYYPGFAGTETLVTQRDPVVRPVRIVGAYSFLPYAPTDVRTAPANLHQITAAPASAAPYVERPVAFSAISTAALVWQYSTDAGTSWLPLANLSGWTVALDATTGASVASLAAVTADLNNLRLRAAIAATGESAFAATLTATPRVILHVDGRVVTSGDGLSWSTAFKSLSDALAVAHEGTDLWIAAGTYSELQLSIPEGAKLYPGFAGTETSFGQRDSSANIVRIQGSSGTASFTGASSISVLRFNIVTAPREAAPYIANPVSFSATRAAWSAATLAWEYSADDGATWQTAVGLADWTITTTGATTTISHPAAPAALDGLRFRVVAPSVNEISASATLIVKARVTRYVRADAPSSPTPNGQSWATAYRTVSAALAAIDNGTDLWIAAGDYAEPTLHFVSGSAIYGGFAGTETLFSERNPSAHIVTLRSTGGPVFATDLATLGALSGATQLDGVTLALGTAPAGQPAVRLVGTAPSFAHVIFTGHAQAVTVTGGISVDFDTCRFSSNTTALTATGGALVLDDCIFDLNTDGIVATGNCSVSIEGGAFTGNTGTALRLGAQANSLVQPIATLNDVTFSANRTGISAYGGAVTLTACDFDHHTDTALAVLDACRLTITGGSFTDNSSAGDGAALRMGGTNPYPRYPVATITGTTFARNQAANGGAIDAFAKNNTLTIADSTFTGNSTTSTANTAITGGGVLHVRDGSVIVITGSTFTGNSTTRFGGVINAYLTKSITVTGSHFEANSATSVGGVIYSDSVPAFFLTDTTFKANTADTSGAISCSGGSNYAGLLTVTRCSFAGHNSRSGSALSVSFTSAAIRDSLFADNRSDGNSAISNNDAQLTLDHVTVANNVSTTTSSIASAIRGTGTRGGTTIRNSILWNNTSALPFESYLPTVEKRQLTASNGLSLSNTIIQGLSTYLGNGLSSANPHFVDSANGDYRLAAWSNAIDRGSASFVLPGETDLAGAARTQAAAPDLGAYETSVSAAPLPSFALPANTGASLDGTFTVTQEIPAGYTATWQLYNGSWQTLTSTTSSAFARSVTISADQRTVTFTGLKSAINDTFVRLVLTNGHDTYTSDNTLVRIQAFAVLHVDGSRASSGDGASWSTAFKTLPEALAAVDGDRRIIWIAAGNYPTATAYQIPQGVEIYGGFPVGGSTFAERSPAANLVVLSGGDTEVVRFTAGNSALAQAVLDGVSVTSGQTGILADGFSPTLRNLVVSGHSATGLVLRDSNAFVGASTFENNTGVNGGGLSIIGGTPRLDRLTIRGNTATLGGGIYTNTGLYLTSSLVSGNLATTGGGFYIAGYPLVEQTTIAANRATATGSAIHVDGGSRITLRNDIVWGNGAAPLTTDNPVFTAAYTLSYVTSEDAAAVTSTVFKRNPYFPAPAAPSAAPTTAGVYTVPAFSLARQAGQFLAANNGALDLAGQPRVAFGTADLGAYEGTDAVVTPYLITTPPAPVAFRRDGVGNVFTASATNATGYEWQIFTGGEWVTLLGNAAFSGADGSTLTVLSADYAMNGTRIRVIVSGPGGPLVSSEAVLTVYPNRYYVKSGATAGGNGDGWATAFPSLQSALAAIPYDTSGTEIWISGGDYLATGTLNLRPGQLIYGGFAGTESTLAERDLSANATRLVAAANSAKTLNLLSTGTTGFAFLLDGLTLDTTTAQTGCAIYNESTRDLVLDHVRILRHERALYQAAAANSTDTVGSLTIRRSEIRGNGKASVDASFILRGGSALIENTLFAGNRANFIGAAEITAPAVLRNVTFAGNLGWTALALNDASSETHNCVFWGNRNGASVTSLQPYYRDIGTQNVIEGYDATFFTDAIGNIAADPAFVAPVSASAAPTIAGDYRLRAPSAAIDLGADTEAASGPVDLAGSARLASLHIDAGAYEYQGTDLYRIATQPTDASAVSAPAVFTVAVAPVTATYVWEESSDNGASYTPVSGATSASLTVPATLAAHGNLFRVQVQFDAGPLVVSDAAELTTVKATVTADIPGGYGTPRDYTATANFTPASWQWEMSTDGTSFTEITDETSDVLSVLGDSSFANRSYRVRATYATGAVVHSNAVAFAYADVAVAPSSAASGTASNLSFGIAGGGVLPSTLTDASLFVHAGLTGRLLLADFAAPVFSGDNVTLAFAPAAHAGERIQITTTSALGRTDGLGLRPQVWEFRTPVTSGTGAFSPPTAIGSASATAFALGDLNSDGSVDALVATANGLQLLTNNGAAVFTISGAAFGPGSASALVLGDLNSSGALDAAVLTNSGDVQLWSNNGAGVFTLGQTLAGLGAQAITLGDLDADGDLDLVLATSSGTRVCLNDGSGSFATTAAFGTGSVHALACGDLDQDGDLDLVTLGDTGTTVWSNNGAAGYTAVTTVADLFDRVALADLDADGRLDIVLVRSDAPATLWRNLGNAAFTTLAAAPGGGGVTTLATGDTDGDGRADLVLTDAFGRTGAWLTSSALTSTRFADQPFFTLGSAAELADLDGDGALDLFALDRSGVPSVANYRIIGSAGDEDTTFGLVSGGFLPTPYASFVYIVELPTHGTLLVNGQPLGGAPNQYHYYAAFDLSNLHTITYRPNPNFSGLDSFGWRDSMSNPTRAYRLSVRNIDDVVVAFPETITALEGDTLTALDGGATSVLSNDTNPDPGALVATVLSGPAHGALTLLANGTFRYVHDGSATTSDSFTYLATNPTTGRSSSATVSIGITRHNVAPSALALTATAGTHYTDQPAGETVATLNATDPDVLDAGLLVYTLVPGDGSAHNGDFVINGASLQTATIIHADFGLSRTVRIRVTDTLGSFSEQAFTVGFTQAPTAFPAALSTDEDNVVAVVLPAAGGDSALAYELTSAPGHGTLTLSTTAPDVNSYDYTPNANYNGTDTFTFRVADSALTSTSATVTITVNAIEDIPTLAAVAPITIDEDGVAGFTLVGADGDGTAVTYQLSSAAAFGIVQIDGANVTYTPYANASGVETLVFTATDGVNTSAPVSVVITITAVNDAPVIAAVGARTVQRNRVDTFTAVPSDVESSVTLRIGTEPQHGSVTLSSFEVTYTPDTGYTGADSYTLIANDGALDSAPATVAVTVAPIATESVALIVYRGLYEYTAVPSYSGTGAWTGAVIGNIGTPAHGTATIEGSQLVYDHNGDTATSDSFTYTVTNAADDIRTISVAVTIKDRILDVTDGSFFSATGNLRTAIDLTNRFVADTIAPDHTVGADWTIRILPQAGATSTLLHTIYDLQSGVSFFRIQGNVTIDASASPGHVLTTYFPDSARHFMVMPGASLTLKHLTLLDGDSPYYVSFGGSVLNFGTFIAEDVVFRGNNADLGAAIFNNGGSVSLTDCVFDQNVVDANNDTGGIVVSRNGSISLTRVTFTANTGKAGGDLYVVGDGALATFSVSDSTIPAFQFVTQNGGTLAVAGLPKAIDDARVYTLGHTLSIELATLLANDLGTPAASVSVAATSAKGVTITRTGDTLAYLAPGGVTGGDSFTYTITDASGRTSTATVSLSFVNAAALPRGNADTGSIYRGLHGTIDVLANDTDDTSDTLTLTAVTQPAHGTTFIQSGVVLYTHNGDAPATDTFTYSVTNSTGTTANVVVNVTIAERILDATSGADDGPGTLRAALSYIDSFGDDKLAPVEPEDPTDADGSRTPDWTIRIVGASGQRWETTTSSVDEFVAIRSAFRIAGKVTIDATLSPGFELQSLLDSHSSAPVRNFFVRSNASLTLKNLRLIGSGNMFFDYVLFGGAVLNEGTFVADHVTFEGYRADRGAAFYNEGGTSTLLDCSFANNENVTFHGHFDGGAVYSTGGSLMLVGNTFADEYINPEVNAQGSSAVFFGGTPNYSYMLGASVTMPDTPIATNDSVERPYGKTFKLSVASLLANDTNAAGATVAFAAATQQGYTLTRSGAFLLYQAPASFGGGDSFTYTITRTVSKLIAGVNRNFTISSTATVNIGVTGLPESATIAPTLTIADRGDGGLIIRVVGIPGRPYTIERSYTLQEYSWTTVDSFNAPANGLHQYEDGPIPDWNPDSGEAPITSRFYRVRYNQ